MTLPTFLARLFSTRSRSKGSERIVDLPDRRLMAEAFVPALAAEGGRILFIGCRGYNRDDYAPCLAAGAEVWTTDIDPRAARWGVAGHHRTGDACLIDQVFSDLTFDAVVCNGIMGHGVDEIEPQRQLLAAIAAILRPGGRLLLGWNTERTEDPVANGLTAVAFVPSAFPGLEARITFDAVTHVYDSLIRT
jgi:SAM-dependent methyltransferase